jgi:hypothetical protein
VKAEKKRRAKRRRQAAPIVPALTAGEMMSTFMLGMLAKTMGQAIDAAMANAAEEGKRRRSLRLIKGGKR